MSDTLDRLYGLAGNWEHDARLAVSRHGLGAAEVAEAALYACAKELREALARIEVPPEGPWAIEHPTLTGNHGEQYVGGAWRVVSADQRQAFHFYPEQEREATAVRDALNRVER